MNMPSSTTAINSVVAALVLLATFLLPAAGAETASYTVTLEAPSVGRRLSNSTTRGPRRAPGPVAVTSTQFLARMVERTQEPVLDAIESHGAAVRGSVRHVLNAVFVRATAEQARQIGSIPGVATVTRSRQLNLRLDSVAEVVGLGALRQRIDGVLATGEGLKIAIIDSGLDFGHEAFRDDSLPPLPGYPKGRSQDLKYASRKVVAVRSYLRLQNSGMPETSTPDDETPRDSSGHGTAVAMIAAGRRVDSPGGPIEGVAPRAYLGIYKVTGTPGINSAPSSQAVIAAIDDAVVDGMDILNLSLGAPSVYPWNAYGGACGAVEGAMECDPLAVAAQSAVTDFGRVVVAAAGNGGADGVRGIPALNSIDSPAIAPDVIAVTATTNARHLVRQVRAGGLRVDALPGSGPDIDPSLTAPMVRGGDLANPDGCGPYSTGALAGAIVVVERGSCRFLDKVENADGAGAVGVVVRNVAGSDQLVAMAALEDTDIPAYFVGAHDGEAIARLPAGTSVTLDATPVARGADPTLVGPQSGRGPTPGLNLKPDVAAPGLGVYTAAPRSASRVAPLHPSGFRVVSGTSFAAPVLAGGAALVWQEHPELTAREVASALINTASRVLTAEGEAAGATAAGGGLVDLESALAPIATVEPPTIGFGRFTGRDMPVWQEIFVTNRTDATHSYSMRVEPRQPDSRAAVSLGGFATAEFVLHPDEYLVVEVRLEGQLPSPGSYEGDVVVARAGSAADLRVPYLYVVADGRPVDAIAVSPRARRDPVFAVAPAELAARFVDAHGAPAVGAEAHFATDDPGIRIVQADRFTDGFGVARAQIEHVAEPFQQSVVASSGGIDVTFWFEGALWTPRLRDVANAASLQAGRPVAPGSIVTVFGQGLSEFEGEAPLAAFPVALKSVSASFDFPELDLSVPGRMIRVAPDQVSLQVPWELAGLNFAYLKVRAADLLGNEFASEAQLVDLADVAPGIYVFTTESGETAPALRHPDGDLVTSDDPARPGGAVSMLMTGNGPLVEPPPSGEAPDEPTATVHRPVVTVAGVPAKVARSEAVPGVAGMYEVEFRVPDSAPAGTPDVVVTIHGASSNVVSLPVRR